MFSNALISVVQTTLLTRSWFTHKITPKIVMYNYLLGVVEYDKSKSQAIMDSIRTGEDSLVDRAINEEVLFEQTNVMVEKLNKELT
jgi:hypothetical protein